MDVHGQKADGKFGVLSQAELAGVIHNRCPGGVSLAHAGHLATYIQNHNGLGGAGAGATSRTYKGNTLFHHTCHGVVAGGATIFFARAAPGIAAIVAVGQHTPAGNDTYNLSWRNGGWGSDHITIS